MSDEFEEAVRCCFRPGVPQDVIARATQYLTQVRSSPDAWKFCLERLFTTQHIEVRFYCLQALQEIINSSFDTLAPEVQAQLRTVLFSWLTNYLISNQHESLPIKNKYAQTLVILFRRQYPHAWPTFFTDFFALLSHGPLLIDMFLRVLLAIDEIIVTSYNPRPPLELQQCNAIKDAMRDHCVPNLAAFWHQVLVTFAQTSPPLVVLALQNISQYIEWIDINLIANDKFIPLFYRFLSIPEFQNQVCTCLMELLAKGMDAFQKIALLEALNMEEVLARHFVAQTASVQEAEFQYHLACVVDRFGNEVIDCLRAIRSTVNVPAGIRKEDFEAKAEAKLDSALQLMFAFLNSSHMVVSAATIEFATAYLTHLKQYPGASEKTSQQLKVLLIVLTAKMRQLEGHTPQADEELDQYRNSLATLFKAIARLNPELMVVHMTELMNLILANFNTCLAADVKAALTLFFWMSEGLPEEAMRLKPCENFFATILAAMLRTNVMAHSSPSIVIASAEVLVRYVRFLPATDSDLLVALLSSFLDQRGIRHPNEKVRRTSSRLLLRLVKTLRNRLHPFVHLIVESLRTELQMAQPLLVKEALEEQLGLVEAIGSLVASIPPNPPDCVGAAAHMSAFVTPYSAQIIEHVNQGRCAADADVVVLGQQVQCLIAFSKGFTLIASPDGRAIWKQALLASFSPLQVLAPHHELDYCLKVVTLAHRMVDMLGVEVLDLLPPLYATRSRFSPSILPEMIKLCNQLLAKLKDASAGLVEAIFAPYLAPCWEAAQIRVSLPIDEVLATVPAQSASQEARERLDLAKLYYHWLYNIVTFNAQRVLAPPGIFEPVVKSLLAASRHADVSMNKIAIGVLRRLFALQMLPSVANGEFLLRWILVHRATFVEDFNCAQAFQDLVRFYREVAAREGDAFVARLQLELAQLLPGVPVETVVHTVLAENDQNRFRNFFREFAKVLPS